MNIEPLENQDLTVAHVRLTRDMRAAAEVMGADEARFMVDLFETKQRERIRNNNRVKALEKEGEPTSLLSHFLALDKAMEAQIGAALQKYAPQTRLGRWMLAQKGVGPLIAARLLAFIDWPNCHNPSQIWSYAGLVPGVVWEKGKTRPWNARLKRVLYLLGESFVKNQGRDDAFYSDIFTKKKKEIWQANIAGKNRDRSLILKEKVGEKTEARRWYGGDVTQEAATMVANGTWPKDQKPWKSEGEGQGMPMLPPAHVHAQARRWVVKLFLAHAWEIGYEDSPYHGDKPKPNPYVIDYYEEHTHIIPRPPGGEK